METRISTLPHPPVAVILLVALLASTGALADDEPPLLSYSIEDQFGRTHTEAACDGAVRVVLGGDRKGSEYVGEWGPRLHRSLGREIDQGLVCSIGFAHLKGAPFFVRRKIIDSFPRNPEAWTLLDWKGHFVRTWGGQKKAANLFVFDRDGRLAMQIALTEYDQAIFDRVVAAVRAELEGNPQ
jgi:hypothetical protein